MEYVLHYGTSAIRLHFAIRLRRIANFPGSHAVTHLRMPEKLATRMMHWCIDCGAQIFAAYNQLITFTYPTHTTHSHAPSRQYNCTMGQFTSVVLNLWYSCHLWHFDQKFLTLRLYFYVTLSTQGCKENDTQENPTLNIHTSIHVKPYHLYVYSIVYIIQYCMYLYNR